MFVKAQQVNSMGTEENPLISYASRGPHATELQIVRGIFMSEKNIIKTARFHHITAERVEKCHSEALAEESRICNISNLLNSSLRSE
jgi:hypothetical protein